MNTTETESLECTGCGGAGIVEYDVSDWRGEHDTAAETCERCDGTGIDPGMTEAEREECTFESHQALKKDPEAWAALAVLAPAGLYMGLPLELRTCRCGSTLAVEVAQEAA